MKQLASVPNPTADGLFQSHDDPTIFRSPATPRIFGLPDDEEQSTSRELADAAPIRQTARLKLPADNHPVLDDQYRCLAESMLDQIGARTPSSVMLVHCDATETRHPTAVHVGHSIARKIKGRVLVVDSDLAGGALSGMLGGSNRAGLSDFLQGEMDWQSSVLETCRGNLFFLPSGLAPVVDSESAGQRFFKLLATLSERFEISVFSSLYGAPLLSRFSDRFCAVYLLIELERTTTKSAIAASQQLRRAGARLVGCISTHDSFR